MLNLFITLICVHLIIINKNNSKLRKMKFLLIIFELIFLKFDILFFQ